MVGCDAPPALHASAHHGAGWSSRWWDATAANMDGGWDAMIEYAMNTSTTPDSSPYLYSDMNDGAQSRSRRLKTVPRSVCVSSCGRVVVLVCPRAPTAHVARRTCGPRSCDGACCVEVFQEVQVPEQLSASDGEPPLPACVSNSECNEKLALVTRACGAVRPHSAVCRNKNEVTYKGCD